MAVAAFERVICLHTRPFVLGKLKPIIEEFLARADRAEEVSPDLLGGLHFSGDLVGPVVRHMAVGATCANAKARLLPSIIR